MKVMTSGPLCLLLVVPLAFVSRGAGAHPGDFLGEGDGPGRGLGATWALDQLRQENDLDDRREENLEKLQEVFGIRRQSDKAAHHKVPPQFMMELYNTIADSSGVTRGQNPYNAKVVRSFIERDTSLSHFYFFNISGLEVNESILEAELHLYRKKTPLKSMHPSTLKWPYYVIRVYQVLDESSLDVPDLHRLLNTRCVGAHSSGWQVFNVKQAVLSWVSGAPNLGLLVTATTLFEDKVTVEFSRRNEFHHSKQPILVLFDDDGSKDHRKDAKFVPRYYAYGNEEEEEKEEEENEELTYNGQDGKIDLDNDAARVRRETRERGEPEEAILVNRPNRSELFERQKKRRRGEGSRADSENATVSRPFDRRRRDSSSRSPRKIVSGRSRVADVLTSMDIYERAMMRERLGGARLRKHRKLGEARRDREGPRASHARERRSANRQERAAAANGTECTRHELYVDFRAIGLSHSIIAPVGYSAYHCKGACETPLSQELQPTNHATVQGIVHTMGLVKGVEMPCCVPTKLLSTSILFYDDNENVVLKLYEDMIADRCGCR